MISSESATSESVPMTDSSDAQPILEVMGRYLQATSDGDLETLVSCYVAAERDHEHSRLRTSGEKLPHFSEVKISDLLIDEDLAELRVSAQITGSEKQMTKYFVLRQRDGEWKISLELTAQRVYGATISSLKEKQSE